MHRAKTMHRSPAPNSPSSNRASAWPKKSPRSSKAVTSGHSLRCSFQRGGISSPASGSRSHACISAGLSSAIRLPSSCLRTISGSRNLASSASRRSGRLCSIASNAPSSIGGSSALRTTSPREIGCDAKQHCGMNERTDSARPEYGCITGPAGAALFAIVFTTNCHKRRRNNGGAIMACNRVSAVRSTLALGGFWLVDWAPLKRGSRSELDGLKKRKRRPVGVSTLFARAFGVHEAKVELRGFGAACFFFRATCSWHKPTSFDKSSAFFAEGSGMCGGT
mmetsp:Transcript_43200/g.90207  ORF Transcript_43200/g.90207 Transcript_43200/m.90207 type:complete len:279 (-) Transcript_43200:148-984(-)